MDTAVETDQLYVYSVVVLILTSAAELPGDAMEAASPSRLEVVFDCDASSAELTWTRARGGFVFYIIFRQAEDEPQASQLHRVDDIDDTTFVDVNLEASTRYTYTVETRSANGSAKSFEGPPAPWQTFTIDDGLAYNVVNSVYQSSDGAMWFGTVNGVSRYDAALPCGE